MLFFFLSSLLLILNLFHFSFIPLITYPFTHRTSLPAPPLRRACLAVIAVQERARAMLAVQPGSAPSCSRSRWWQRPPPPTRDAGAADQGAPTSSSAATRWSPRTASSSSRRRSRTRRPRLQPRSKTSSSSAGDLQRRLRPPPHHARCRRLLLRRQLLCGPDLASTTRAVPCNLFPCPATTGHRWTPPGAGLATGGEEPVELWGSCKNQIPLAQVLQRAHFLVDSSKEPLREPLW
jgi:hypothetical protein